MTGRGRAPGWVPRQHGAWAMLAVPLVVGVVHAGPAWWHLLLAATWLVGYLAFQAAGLLLKARGRPRHRPPLLAYGAATAALGLPLLLVRPSLLWWAPLYAVLLTVSLAASWRRAERSLLNDGVTMAAACLLAAVAHTPVDVPVAAAATAARSGPAAAVLGLTGGSAAAWQLVALLALYFFGTALYVKTMIRERGNPAMLTASITWHLLAVAAVTLVMAAGPGAAPSEAALVTGGAATPLDPLLGPPLGLFFALLTVRAALVPRRWPHATPKAIGLGEVAASVVLTVLLLAA